MLFGRRGPTLRLALTCGFGLTFGLWLFAGYQVTQRLAGAERERIILNARYVEAQDVLSSVRAQVLLASVLIRDALLDPTPQPADHRQEVEGAYQAIDLALARYAPPVDPGPEQGRVTQLRTEIELFRTASLDALDASEGASRVDARLLLQRFLPKRASIIAVSEEIQSINRAAYVGQQTAAARLQTDLQRQVWIVLGAALAVSLAIAWVALRHAVRLEGHLVEQRSQQARTVSDLHRLSARLVSVQEDERRRIARELHDEVGQALSAVNVELTVAEQSLQRAGIKSDVLDDARRLADSALRSVRDLSQLLHPSALDDLGLGAALESFLAGFGKRTGIVVDYRDERASDARSPDAERAVYRIVQEAMTNVARHARARRVTVRLESTPGRLLVRVDDDGIGFDAAAAQHPDHHRGLGLVGMRERVAQLRGTLRIDGRAGRGTRLEVDVPIDVQTDAAAAAGTAGAIDTPARSEVTHG